MTISAFATPWPVTMDPSDKSDWLIDAGPLLDLANSEAILSYTITLGAEAVAAGLLLGSGINAPSQPTPTTFRLWFSINPSNQADAGFDGNGANLPVVIKITTTTVPARVFERTLLLKVAQQ